MASWDNPVYEAALAYQKTAAVLAAIKFDIFTLIGEGHQTCDVLSERTGASKRGIRILCDYLTSIDLLEKRDMRYSATPVARRYLDASSPASIASSIDFFASPETLRLVLDDPASYVRRGGSDGRAVLAPDHPIWTQFANGMTPVASLTAKRMVAYLVRSGLAPVKVLDVAAGHGFYGIEVGRAFPEAMVTAIDWPGVLQLAGENAEKAGIADRFLVVPGSAFDVEWGREFDLIIVANFLHHFDAEGCATILRKAKSSLSSNGRVCAVEFVPNEDRVSPSMPAAFAFWMLATTPSGDAYTHSDLVNIAKNAGFSGVTSHALKPTPQTLILFER